MRIYGVYDLPAKQCVCCFAASSDTQAHRMFYDLLTNPEDTLYSLHPSDFGVYLICEHDESKVTFDDFLDNGVTWSREYLNSRRLERAEYVRQYREILNGKLGEEDDGNKQ